MTEETEETKPRKNRIFYWLGGFIIVGLLVLTGQYLYWKFLSSDSKEPVNRTLAYKDTKLSAAIKDYGNWSASLAGKKMDVDHELTQTGLNKIANILDLMSANQNNNTVHADISRIYGLADSITYNWKSGKHADMIKLAFAKTTDVMSALQLKQKPAFAKEINVLKLKVKQIDTDTLTLNQRDQVKDVFNQTASVLSTL
ncbi:MAG: hypothetical protein EOP42_13585 [Sphingobacteriaceae bacterium]|nr:MAG: hypothetical protein EOP42_13585 [Sphingobacteriaceae bacterium]